MKAELSDVERAHQIYTPRTLALYDWWVHGVSNRCFWKCPTEKLLELFRTHITSNHLEVGAGTGFFPAQTLKVGGRLALLDINRHCLDRASKRLAGHRPEIYQENVLEPLPLKIPPFDSISLNYVLHCLPGVLEEKAGTAIDHLLPLLAPGGTIFGSTLLGKDIQRPLLALPAMAHYNRKGVFSNKEDSLGGMMGVLSKRFKTFNVEVHGCVVLFWAKGVKSEKQITS